MPKSRGKRYVVLRVKPGRTRVAVLSEEVFGVSTYWVGRLRISWDKDVNAEPRDPSLKWKGYLSVVPLEREDEVLASAEGRRVMLELTEEAGRQVQAIAAANGASLRGVQLVLSRRTPRGPVSARKEDRTDQEALLAALPEAEDCEDAVRRIYRVDWEKE